VASFEPGSLMIDMKMLKVYLKTMIEMSTRCQRPTSVTFAQRRGLRLGSITQSYPAPTVVLSPVWFITRNLGFWVKHFLINIIKWELSVAVRKKKKKQTPYSKNRLQEKQLNKKDKRAD